MIEEISPIVPKINTCALMQPLAWVRRGVRSTHPVQMSLTTGAAGVQLGPHALAIAADLAVQLRHAQVVHSDEPSGRENAKGRSLCPKGGAGGRRQTTLSRQLIGSLLHRASCDSFSVNPNAPGQRAFLGHLRYSRSTADRNTPIWMNLANGPPPFGSRRPIATLTSERVFEQTEALSRHLNEYP